MTLEVQAWDVQEHGLFFRDIPVGSQFLTLAHGAMFWLVPSGAEKRVREFVSIDELEPTDLPLGAYLGSGITSEVDSDGDRCVTRAWHCFEVMS